MPVPYIYVDRHERDDVVAYMDRFCKRWFDRYFPRMKSYEGPEIVEILPKLAGHESKIVPVFHDESIFNSNEDQRCCRLEKDKQILKPKSRRRGFTISEFVCPCHGRMVDTDTGEPSRVMLNYVKNYNG